MRFCRKKVPKTGKKRCNEYSKRVNILMCKSPKKKTKIALLIEICSSKRSKNVEKSEISNIKVNQKWVSFSVDISTPVKRSSSLEKPFFRSCWVLFSRWHLVSTFRSPWKMSPSLVKTIYFVWKHKIRLFLVGTSGYGMNDHIKAAFYKQMCEMKTQVFQT